MTKPPKDPFRPLDDEARTTLADLMTRSRHAALAVCDALDGMPNISRVAFVRGPDGAPLSLISDLSGHAAALKANPDCGLLIGEPEPKGDPLTHPRLSLRARATFVRHGDPRHGDLAAHIVTQQPKAKLYIGFGDFSILTFTLRDGLLNGGFGKAYKLTAQDILDA